MWEQITAGLLHDALVLGTMKGRRAMECAFAVGMPGTELVTTELELFIRSIAVEPE